MIHYDPKNSKIRSKGANIHEIYGEVLTDNSKMLSLAKKLGYTTQWLLTE